MPEKDFKAIREDLLRYLLRLTGDQSKAEDLTQEAMLRVMDKGIDAKETDEFRAYLFRSAYNLVVDQSRTTKRRPEQRPIEDVLQILPDKDSENEDSLELVIRKEMESCLEDLLKELPEPDRQALALVVYGSLKVREAAAVVGIKPDSMKVRLHRARNRVKTLLDRDCIIDVDCDGKRTCEKK